MKHEEFTSQPAWAFAHVETEGFESVEEIPSDFDSILDINGLTVKSADGSEIELVLLNGMSVTAGSVVTDPCDGIYMIRTACGTFKLALKN